MLSLITADVSIASYNLKKTLVEVKHLNLMNVCSHPIHYYVSKLTGVNKVF